MAAEADGEVSAGVEIIFLVEHPVHDLRQCRPHLTVAEILGQCVLPGHEGQGLHCRHAVGDAAAEDGEGSLWRDEAFEDDGKLLTAQELAVVIVLVVEARIGLGVDHRLQRLEVHGVEDVGAVVVESEGRSVGIPSVADIPFFHLPACRIDAVLVVGDVERRIVGCGLGNETLYRRREQQPVGVRRVYLP